MLQYFLDEGKYNNGVISGRVSLFAESCRTSWGCFRSSHSQVNFVNSPDISSLLVYHIPHILYCELNALMWPRKVILGEDYPVDFNSLWPGDMWPRWTGSSLLDWSLRNKLELFIFTKLDSSFRRHHILIFNGYVLQSHVFDAWKMVLTLSMTRFWWRWIDYFFFFIYQTPVSSILPIFQCLD